MTSLSTCADCGRSGDSDGRAETLCRECIHARERDAYLDRLVTLSTAVSAGSTWGEFKAAAERLGLTDATPLGSIEYGCSQRGTNHLHVDVFPSGVEVREI